MRATEAMGKAIFDRYWAGAAGRPGPDWGDIGDENQADWCAMAQAVLDIAEQTDRDPPSDYVEATVEKVEVEQGVNSNAQMMTLRLHLPYVSRFTRNPGSQQRAVSGFAMAAANKRNVVRLSVVSDEKVKSDFARREADGTLREFSENEATW